MLWLLGSILLNAFIFVLFRRVGQLGLPLLPVVVLNYAVCFALGVLLGAPVFEATTYSSLWWVLGLVEGVLFVSFFFLIGYLTHRSGIAYTTVLSKLSVVIPVLAAIVLFNESLAPVQWLGVGATLVATVLVNARAQGQTLPRDWRLGALLFIGTGVIDTNFKVFDAYFGAQVPVATFLTFVFGTAGVTGGLVWALRRGAYRLGPRVAVAGLLLGLVNYGALLCLLEALNYLPAALFFPLNNIGQLVLATGAGLWLFRERLSPTNGWGLALALLGIVLLTFAQWQPLLAG